MRISAQEKEARIANQCKINAQCIFQLDKAAQELKTLIDECYACNCISGERFRSCNARVYRTDNYVILQSYKSVVALINVNSSMGYDILRLTYGYTATSAQHISKFFNDYYTIDKVRFDTIYDMNFALSDYRTKAYFDHLCELEVAGF